MKINRIIFIFTLLSIGMSSKAQDCGLGISEKDIVTQRAQVTHNHSSVLWETGVKMNDDNLSENIVVAGGGAGIWLSGFDESGNLKVCAQTYGGNSNRTDFWPGPLNNEGIALNASCQNFDKFWKVQKSEIDEFLEDYNDNGIIDNPIPDAIISWPGRDNPMSVSTNGFILPTNKNLAPFIDRNGDNVYNPTKGDVPDVKGADVALWWIINDNGNIHTQTNGDPMKVEIAILAYSFDDSYPSGNSTFFYEYNIVNKSGQALEDLKVGIWMDADIGCSEDDYVGCLPTDNLGFVYNRDDTDGDAQNACGGSSTFNNGLPLFGVKLLEGVKDENGIDFGMTSFACYYRPGFGGPWPSATTDPTTAIDYDNFMSGKWRDGTPFSNSGYGYNPGNTDTTPFVFPGNPSNDNVWTMCSESLESVDQRFVLTSGGAKLESGENVKVAYSVIVSGAVEHPCPDITPLIDAANAAQNLYNNLSTSHSQQLSEINFAVFPNPAHDFINITTDENEQINTIQLFNINGQQLQTWNAINASNYKINVDNISDGMYLMKIEMKNGTIGAKRVVIN